ncbi:5551_t:CDS:2 [Cetraspora pellucida]|uniref:5551_t:CDS:1 n=1 Tax=Cetraspora pellucida TaxID=1433469 RepID=A0A9N9FEG4_9GLOM|nr:5551_t:CDS:2 [Cetraspora pellucida]
MNQEELQKGKGSISLILAPTRELASQIYIEAKKFAKIYDGIEALSSNLNQVGHEYGALHGNIMQVDHDKVLKDFKNNKFSIMVATDVAARELNIKAVKTIINYDITRNIDLHVHQIGAGEKGTAYTLIIQKEDKFAVDLVRNLEASSQQVLDNLMNLVMQNSRFRKSRSMIHRGRGKGCSRSIGSNSNAISLKGRAGIGSANSMETEIMLYHKLQPYIFNIQTVAGIAISIDFHLSSNNKLHLISVYLSSNYLEQLKTIQNTVNN